jgi:phosphoesterase RecJ-like protein
MHGTGEPLGRFTREVPVEARDAADEVAHVLRSAPRVLVLGHAGADGDVCGSSLGLAQALREMGKDVVVYNAEPYPSSYAWLPGGDLVVTALSPDATFDATVVVDAARPDRLGPHFPDADRRGTFVWLDHHKNNDPPGDVNYIDLTAAAVGEQVALILDSMGHAISLDVARCLYASLLADTGSFRYGNTSARAFRLAARLVEAGVDPWEMTERIYESQDEAKLRLLGRVIASMWLSPDGRLGVVELSLADVRDVGARDEHIQGLVNHVRGVRGVEIAVLLREVESGTQVIARSRGNVPVAPAASALGAIGHRNAATFVLARSLADARRDVVDAFLAALPAPSHPDNARAAE